MEVDVYKKDGSLKGQKVTLDPAVFEIEPNDHAVYQAVRSFMANQRQGNHKVKPRNEVRGGGRKPYRQKKTGRARAGTSRSPVWIGGGSIFGPMPHDYVVSLPDKVKKLARKSALTYKAKENSIVVVEDFSLESPKTKDMMTILRALSLGGKKTLFLTATTDSKLVRSGRNIPSLSVLEASKASTYDILNHRVLLVHESAVKLLEQSSKN